MSHSYIFLVYLELSLLVYLGYYITFIWDVVCTIENLAVCMRFPGSTFFMDASPVHWMLIISSVKYFPSSASPDGKHEAFEHVR